MTENRLVSITSRAKEIISEAKELSVRAGTEKLNIMCVTKNQHTDAIKAINNAGISIFGENKVQQYITKKEFYESIEGEVHFIGHLQSNKVKQAVGAFKLIQSVDSLEIARRISDRALQIGVVQDILIEINAGRDPGKFGFFTEQAEEAIKEIGQMRGVMIKGLMTIPAIGNDYETTSAFSLMRKLFIDIKRKKSDNAHMEILSMGMSADYKIAIREGSNMIRLGTVLFN